MEFNLQDLYKKSTFKKTNIEKTVERDRKDKEQIIQYESSKKLYDRNSPMEEKYKVYTKKEEEIIEEILSDTPVEDQVAEHYKITSKTAYTFNDKKVDNITGIGPSYSKRLRDSGITTISELLSATNTPSDLEKLQGQTGIYTKMLEKWRIQADFLRIYGIGNDQIEKLSEIGIDSTYQLASNIPESLREKLLSKYLYTEVPSLGIVKRWIRIANELQKIDSL